MAIRRKKSNFKLVIVILTVLLILLLICLITKSKTDNSRMSSEEIEKANIEYKNKRNEEIKKDLSDKTEQERMQYYCADFFRLIDNSQYEEAYKLLYGDYKENYFPTLQNFKRYFEEYFPSDFGLSYTNIERLGDIYVLMIEVKDTASGSFGHNFSMYVVLQEKALNDYVISFSRNSAVGEEE